ncbi:MAG TPA: hypothetical protein VK563_21720 [Puia sp.]|nr:hypothetical protein [Puia sp.]
MAIVQIREDTSTKMYNLTFGDSSFTVMIMGVFPSGSIGMRALIKKSIQSIYYDRSMKLNPFALVPFKLDQSHSIFHLARYESAGSGISPSVYYYSIDGAIKDSYAHESYLKVICKPAFGVSADQGGALMESSMEVTALKKRGLYEVSIKNQSEQKVNGLDSYQEEIYGTLDLKETLIFQHVVLIDDKIIVM